MTYTSGTWRLPTLTKQKTAKLHHRAYLSVSKSLQATISDSNQYKALLELAYNSEPLLTSVLPANIATVLQGLRIPEGLPGCSQELQMQNVHHLQRSTRLQAFEESAEEDLSKQEQEEKGSFHQETG
eukprot:2570099-Rhodomonas_salina.4